MANIISKEIFSIGKGGMRKKQSSAAVLWIYYTGTWPKKILWMRYFVYVKERHAWKASVAFGATTSVELREVRQWQSISPTIRKAWTVEEEGTRQAARQPGKKGRESDLGLVLWLMKRIEAEVQELGQGKRARLARESTFPPDFSETPIWM
jgi:hypothetical protein